MDDRTGCGVERSNRFRHPYRPVYFRPLVWISNIDHDQETREPIGDTIADLVVWSLLFKSCDPQHHQRYLGIASHRVAGEAASHHDLRKAE